LTRRIDFHEFARDEYIAAARWYEDRQEGLGREFMNAVESLIERAADDRLPGLAAGTPSAGVMKLLELRFGYAIYFELGGDVMYVWAVAHGHRRPSYWWGRLQENG
jgi:plasmid stabilization system protein ParE